MAWRAWLWCVVSALIVMGMGVLAGCPAPEPEQTTMVEPSPEPAPVPADEPAVEEPAAEEPEPEAGEASAAAAEFEWTETPSVEAIPDHPVAGMVHKQAFAAQTIRIEKKDEDTYQMQISNGELTIPGSVTSTITNDDGWRFRFSVDEGAPVTKQWAIDDEKTFADEHVYYYYAQGDGKPPMSVNGPWGAALQITEWTVEEPSEGSRVIGTVKGRVALVMRDTDRSWAAGTFEAPVFSW